MVTWPRIGIIGGGAAGLWCALRLVERGCPGSRVCIIEPEPKLTDDRTWSYWTREPIVPRELLSAEFAAIELGVAGALQRFETSPYVYQSLRSSRFYAFAKTRLAAADVTWVQAAVATVVETEAGVTLRGSHADCTPHETTCEYALDSRLPVLGDDDALPAASASTTLYQPFGGWFVEASVDCFDPGVMTFMDFDDAADDVAFAYVIPESARRALVEIAQFTTVPRSRAEFDRALSEYLRQRFGLAPESTQGQPSSSTIEGPDQRVPGFGESRPSDPDPTHGGRLDEVDRHRPRPGVITANPRGTYRVVEREYGTIPMTDRALWRASTARVWKIGTAGGWVQPSSGYAFTRIARFADEVAASLGSSRPRPWRPRPVQQLFNSVMLGHLAAHPDQAARTFVRLFEGAGAATAFAFLDERASVAETLRVMNASPRMAFAKRTAGELLARLRGTK